MSDQSTEIRLRCPICLAVFRTEFACCPVDGAELGEWSPDCDPLIGGEIAGRYVLEELVGQGSMGIIYRARHVHLPRTFAIKILFGDLVADPRMRIRFAQEAALASRLGHPYVVSVVDFGRSESGLLYLVMDYVEGEALSALIEREAPLDPLRVVRLARQLAEGLAHAHEHGLVHRDFKPGNVVLEDREDGASMPRILDFGLAISTREREDTPGGRLTEFGFIVGTPIYIAPEQALDRVVDHRADLFALGVVMYEMLAGLPPYDGRPVEIAHKNVHYPVPAIAERSGVAVPPELERIVRRLLEKSPENRFSSAAKLCEALDEVEAIATGQSPAAGTGPFVRDDGPTEDPHGRRVRESDLRLPTRWFGMSGRTAAAGAGALFVAGFLAFSLIVRAGTDGPVDRPLMAASETEPVIRRLDAPAAAPATASPAAPDAPAARSVAASAPAPAPAANAVDAGPRVAAQAAAPVSRDMRSAHAAQARARRRVAERARREVSLEQDVADRYGFEGDEPVAEEELGELEPVEATDPGAGEQVAADTAMASAAGAPAMPASTTPPRATDGPPAAEAPAAEPQELDPQVAVRRLVREYREVGEAIAALQARQGDGAAKRFRERYFRLPYGDALRIAAVRKDTLAALEGLRLEIMRAARGGG